MTQDKPKKMVIFRFLTKGTAYGDIAAVFPATGYNVRCGYCMVFWNRRWTQHNYSVMIQGSRPATPEEYAETKHFLETEGVMTRTGLEGYNLAIRKHGPSKKALDKWLRDGNK